MQEPIETYEFPPEDFNKIQIGLLIDILAHQLTVLDIVRKIDRNITDDQLSQGRKMRRSEILQALYAQYGKTPEI